MRRGIPFLMLAIAVLTAGAVAQEIVIEPTNGRVQATGHVSRPATVESASGGKATTSPLNRKRSTTRKPAKKLAAEQVATVKTKPSVSPAGDTNIEATQAAPAPKKIPARPEWAMADTRDARSLQIEITSALARDPKLAGSAIQVDVDDNSVTLQGRAAGGEEHLQVQRLAQSYAWNRKLVDHIEVVPSISQAKAAMNSSTTLP